MIGRCITAVAVLLATAGVADAARRVQSGAEEARAAVQSALNDPAAVFERVSVQKDAVCGVVEATNDRGIDTGKMLFVYIRGERKAYVLNSRPADGPAAEAEATDKYQEHCQR